MVQVTDDQFHDLVEAAVQAIPKRFADHLDNVAFLIAPDPSPGQLEAGGALHGHGLLLGLYQGIPLPRRNGGYSGVTPDVITVFKHPHERLARDTRELADNVHETVWHEVAHYFGLDHGAIGRLKDGPA